MDGSNFGGGSESWAPTPISEEYTVLGKPARGGGWTQKHN